MIKMTNISKSKKQGDQKKQTKKTSENLKYSNRINKAQ